MGQQPPRGPPLQKPRGRDQLPHLLLLLLGVWPFLSPPQPHGKTEVPLGGVTQGPGTMPSPRRPHGSHQLPGPPAPTPTEPRGTPHREGRAGKPGREGTGGHVPGAGGLRGGGDAHRGGRVVFAGYLHGGRARGEWVRRALGWGTRGSGFSPGMFAATPGIFSPVPGRGWGPGGGCRGCCQARSLAGWPGLGRAALTPAERCQGCVPCLAPQEAQRTPGGLQDPKCSQHEGGG